MKNALIIGSQGTIGEALAAHLSQSYSVHQISRSNCDYSEASLTTHAEQLKNVGSFDLIICCIGVLHNETLSPEKRLANLDADKLLEYYRINTVLPALCLKVFTPLLKRPANDSSTSKFVLLSAMVGSIEDNGLGGWYGYRSSKAALNMLIKCSAIEVGRMNKKAAIVAMHPGTTIGPLSKPFSGSLQKDNYYTPEQSAERIVAVAESLNFENNGQFLNWDGTQIAW